MSEVEIVQHPGWAELVLNRPEVRNAINGPLGVELAAKLRELDADEDVRAILLRGADGAFCSGLDLKSFNADPAPAWLADFGTIWREAHKALYEARKPIVAVLQRYAINGGAALALAADVLLVGETAFLQVGEVQQGMAAPYNIAWLRLRHSEAITSQLTLIGRRFSGVELKELGLAYAVAADESVLAEAQQLLEQLAGFPADSLTRVKATLRRFNDTPADEWFDRATQGIARGRPPKANPE